MGIEIERKFLVNKQMWELSGKPKRGIQFRQGYMTDTPEKTIRIRITDEKGYLTIKGASNGLSRAEFEYEIPRGDASELLDHFCETSIEKIRYKICYENKLWEVDEFSGLNQGLIMAEIELQDENEHFQLPGWITKEVTGDHRYYNAYLARHPYRDWMSL